MATMPSFYQAGTISVAANGTAVTGVGTAFASQVKPGDLLKKGTASAIIASIEGNAGLTLAEPWSGSALTNEAGYFILRTGAGWSTTVEVQAKLTDIIDAIDAGLQVTGAIALSYIFSELTADADPGNGYLRLDSTDPSAATKLRLDLVDARGINVASLLDALTISTSPTKSQIRVFKTDNPDRWAVYDVSSQASPTGYRNVAISFVASSSATPFVSGDAVTLVVDRNGDIGLAGASSGFSFGWSTNTAATDPGTGKVKANHATLASATALYLSKSDAAATNLAAEIATWDDSTSAKKARIKIADAAAPQNFVSFDVTGTLTDNPSWVSFPVAFVASAGTIANNAGVVVNVSIVGEKGATGNTGATGPATGVTLAYSSTTADADPGNGTFRLNSTTISSVTAAYVDNVESGGASISAWLDSFAASTSVTKGFLLFRGVTTQTAFALFRVTGSVVDGSGYRKLTLAHLASVGTWTNGHSFALNFSPAGDKGDTGATGGTGGTGATGAPGADGLDGFTSGFRFAYSTTTTDADPGNGIFRADSATFGAISKLYVSETDASGGDVSAWLGSLDDSTNANHKGYLRLERATSPDTYWEFAVVASVVDAGAYRKIEVSPIAASGTFLDGEPVVVTFARTGDKGVDGLGAGDVIGPSSATDGEIALFDTVTGKKLKSSGVVMGVFGKTLAATANAGAARTALGLVPGTDVIAQSALDTDGTLAANSDAKIPSQKAAKTYVDGAISALRAGVSSTYDTLAKIATALGTKLTASSNLSDVASAATAFANIKQPATTSSTGVVKLATAADYRGKASAAGALPPDEVWNAAAYAVLVDAATIAVDFSAGFNFAGTSEAPLALTANRTLGAPTNVKSGQCGIISIGASGATRTLTLDPAYLLCANVEAGPYSITTSQELDIVYACRGSLVLVTAIIRRG